MEEKRKDLSKALGRTDVLALGVGTMVGWSWVVLTTMWVMKAGFGGTILAFIIGASIIVVIGLAYAELTSALPVAGGELAYVYRGLGIKAGWLVGWIMTLAYVGVSAWEGIAIATAFDCLFTIPHAIPLWEISGYTVYLSWAAVGMIGAAAMMMLNLFATKPAVIFQVMCTVALFVVAFIILFGGISYGSIDNIGEIFTSKGGFIYVLLLVPSMLIGFDVIPQAAEEMNISRKEMGKILVVCIIVATIWYLVVIVGMSLAAPVEIKMSGGTTAAQTMSYAYGDGLMGSVVIVGGIIGILTCWNGFFMTATRLIFAMGRAKMLPQAFGRLHPKYKTPWTATLFIGGICIIAPLMGENALIWLVNISSFAALFSYFCVALSFMVIRKKEPYLHRPFKVKNGKLIGSMAVALSAIYLLLYVMDVVTVNLISETAGKKEYFIIIGWLLIGLGLLVYTKKQSKNIDPAERELLIFGERFARRNLK